MPEDVIDDLVSICDGVISEHKNDWQDMKPEEKREWVNRFAIENAHPIESEGW